MSLPLLPTASVSHEVNASSELGPETESRNTTRLRRRFSARKFVVQTRVRLADKKSWLVLLAALALVVLEGSIRKWVIGSEAGKWSYLAYFSKDIVFAALLLLPVRQPSSPALKTFGDWLIPGSVLLGIGAVISSVQGFNPVGAGLTFRATIFLPVVAWLAVTRLAGLPLRWVAWLLAILTLLNFGLGTFQNRLPADHFVNRYVAETENIVAEASGTRATGTFSYITGLAVISSVGIWAGMALLSLARNRWDQIGGILAIGAGFGCALASISRGPVFIGVAMVAIWLAFPRAGLSVLSRSLVASVGVVVLVVSFGLAAVFSQLWGGFQSRLETAGDSTHERVFGQLGETVLALKTSPLGNGFGTEQVGGNYASAGIKSFTNFETQLPRLVLEAGVLGLLGFAAICIGAILALQRAKRDAPDTGTNAMLLATQTLLLPMFYTNVIFNHTASAFVWMIFAAVLAASSVSAIGPTLKPTKNKRSRSRHAVHSSSIAT